MCTHHYKTEIKPDTQYEPQRGEFNSTSLALALCTSSDRQMRKAKKEKKVKFVERNEMRVQRYTGSDEVRCEA